MISENNSTKIKNMAVVCSFLVVCIHCSLPQSQTGQYLVWALDKFFVQGVARIAVPFFFLVSGYFLASHYADNGWWMKEVTKRIKSLVVPYVAWALIMVIISLPLNITADYLADRSFGTNIQFFSFSGWIRILGLNLFAPPDLKPLWYLRCLFIFVLTSPIIMFVIKKSPYLILSLMFVFSIVGMLMLPKKIVDFFDVSFSLRGLFYFSFGAALNFWDKKTTVKYPWLCLLVGLCFVMLKPFALEKSYVGACVLANLSIPFLLVGVWWCVPSKKWPLWITTSSFPIYLGHELFFNYIEMAESKFHLSKVGALIVPCLELLIGFAGSIALAVGLRKWASKSARFIFGGR